MIRWTTVFVDRPASSFDVTRDFWMSVTGTSESSTRGEHDEFSTLVPSDGDAWLRMQRIDDGPGGSHLDLHVDDVTSIADRVAGCGADVMADLGSLVVLRSPGGLPFCVVSHDGEATRAAPVGRLGGRTLVDQVCIDIAPDRFDEECQFWTDVTGWAFRPGVEPEYAVLDRPPGMPLRFLLQRRGAADAGRPTECHLDLACDDIPTSVDEHVALGATFVEQFSWWTVMADPAGLPYCLTRRNPDTGTA